MAHPLVNVLTAVLNTNKEIISHRTPCITYIVIMEVFRAVPNALTNISSTVAR